MRRVLLIVFTFLSVAASAQNLTGIWRGHFKSAFSSKLDSIYGIDDRYKFEAQINQKDKVFEGVTYSYKTTVFYGKAACMGTISSKTKKVLLGETKLIEVKSEGGGACLMTCFLQYSKVGNEEFLEGTYSSIGARDSTQCGGGTVFLRKVATSDFYEEQFLVEKKKAKPDNATKITPLQPDPPVVKKTIPAPKPQQPKSAPMASAPKAQKAPKKAPPRDPVIPQKNEVLKQLPGDSITKKFDNPTAPVPVPRVLATRKNELVQTIATSANEVMIKIYDNGSVDNDTVSVYVDNKLVISRQRLTENAITLTVSLNDNLPFHELVMVAENLGEIPPNTSLMVVTAGEEQYEVRITSNEQKNAVVRFTKKIKT